MRISSYVHNRRAPHTWFFQEKIPNDHLLYVLLQKVEIHIVSLQKRRLIKPRCNHLALGHSKGFSCHLQVFEVNQVSKHIRVFLYQFRNLASAHKKIRRDLKKWKKKMAAESKCPTCLYYPIKDDSYGWIWQDCRKSVRGMKTSPGALSRRRNTIY